MNTGTSVRRNLFHQNLSRRPASAGPPNGTAPSMNTNGLSNRPSNRLKPTISDSSSRSTKLAENRDIVVRDKNGGYKLDMPALPRRLAGDNGEEHDGLEPGETSFDSLEIEREKENYEAAIVEMMIRHRNRQSSGEPDEILNIVHQSLIKKASSLDDDNWMFEPEFETRL
ncbi:hypothetical protein N7466_009860 [Penicillium verhagenii]|uniref:uncharacterized protein n=1 Tax=Penicillium verhagenii TaxID=1562060 RepID=UPI0025454C7B|nr:uncharacterized protein N7466_009860 [Penicillium verhagenii]KAJ5921534.1 hypothetical protein N7466_009860 [Penicillium verhagenii]